LARIELAHASAAAGLDDAEEASRHAASTVSACEQAAAEADRRLSQERVAIESCKLRRDEARASLSEAREALAEVSAELARLAHARDLDSARGEALRLDQRRLEEERDVQSEALTALQGELARAQQRVVEHEHEVSRCREIVRDAERV